MSNDKRVPVEWFDSFGSRMKLTMDSNSFILYIEEEGKPGNREFSLNPTQALELADALIEYEIRYGERFQEK